MARIATIAAAFLLLAAAASPAGALQVKRSQKIKGPLATVTLDAKCPKGTRATGGGFRETVQNVITLGVVYESRKIGQRIWRVSAQIQDKGAATGRVKVTAAAYCDAEGPRTTARSKTVTIPGSNLIGGARAACPGGKVAVAGGFETPLPAVANISAIRNQVTGSSRSGVDGWKVQAVSGIFGAADHTAYVYCADQGPDSVQVGKGKVRNPAGATKFNPGSAVSPPCPGRQSVLSGGFRQSPIIFDISRLTLAYPFASLAGGDRWKAAAVQAGGTTVPAVTTLRAIAYCG